MSGLISMKRRGFWIIATAGFVSACSSPSQSDLNALTGVSNSTSIVASAPVNYGAPTVISIHGGNNQNGAVNTVLSNPLSARVTDSNGIPVPDVLVTFAVASGGGVVTSTAITLTDATGVANASVRLGPTIGAQTFTATMSSGVISSVTFTGNSLATPSYLRIVAASPAGNTTPYPATSVPVGTPIELRTVLVDVSGNYLKDIPSTWYSSGSLLPANLSVTNAGVSASLTPTVASNGTVQALISDANLISLNNIVSTSAVTGVITANAVAANNSIMILSGNNQTATVGTALSNPLSVKVVDGSGNPVQNVAVNFAAVSGGGSVLTSPSTVLTDSSGVASVAVLLGSAVGTQTFTAMIPAGTATSVVFSASALAVPSYLKIYALAGSTPVGTSSYFVGDSIQFRTVLVDSGGNFIKEIPAKWSVSGSIFVYDVAISGGNPSKYATFAPTTTGSGMLQALIDDSGLISQNNIVSTSTATGTFTIALPLIPDVIQIISGNNQSGQVGQNLASNLVVKVVNVANAPVPGVAVTFSVSSGGGQIMSAQPVVTNSNGEASCIVRLGGTIGSNLQSYTASMATGSSKTALFTATATFGAPAELAFTTQPSGGNTGTLFSTQPVVELRDSYGNRITSDSTSTVSLSVEPGFGQGALSGITTATFNSGIATFNQAIYTFGGSDTTSTSIKLRATANLAGVSNATSEAFTIGLVIANAQCNATAGWQTIDGGCKDITSGLVWSSLSASTLSWHQAVWAQATSGSSPAEPWEVARGLTFDYSGTVTNHDTNAVAYCHDLVESGYSDWRMATYSEAQSAAINGGATALKNSSQFFWTGNANSATTASIYQISTNSPSNPLMTSSNYVRCVRQSPPSKLIVASQVSGSTFGLGTHVAFAVQPAIRIADATQSTITYATNPVTLSVTSGTGQLCTTSTATGVTSACSTSKTITAVNGVATFSGLSYSGNGAVTLTASSSGLPSIPLNSFTVSSTYPKANCLLVGGVWINANGGCKDTTTGLIYNHSSYNGYAGGGFSMAWKDYIWDQNSVPANAGTQEVSDDGRTNDYDFSPTYASYNQTQGTNPDNTAVNYCHSLQESGQTDWLPLPFEGGPTLLQSSGKAPSTYLDNGALNTVYHWTNLVMNGNTANVTIQFTTLATTTAKSNSYYAICVRRDPPVSLAFANQPAFPTTCPDGSGGTLTSGAGNDWGCNGAGTPFSQMPTVIVKDAEGAGPLFYDNSTIKIEVVPASDGSGGTGRILRFGSSANNESNRVIYAKKSLTMTASNGTAAFTNLGYDKAGEKFRLKATGTVTWQGQVITFAPVLSNDLYTTQTYILSRCRTYSGFTTQNGGCQNTGAGGLVWMNPGGGAWLWAEGIWDSSNGDPRKVRASDGITLEAGTHDFDLANALGAGTDTSTIDVCHRSYLNGYYDWRMPTYAEMDVQLKASGSGRYGIHAMRYVSGQSYFWSSRTDPANANNAYMMGGPTNSNYLGGWYGVYAKAFGGAGIFCVRDPANATSLYLYPDSP